MSNQSIGRGPGQRTGKNYPPEVVEELHSLQGQLQALANSLDVAPGSPPRQPRDIAVALTRATSICSKLIDIAEQRN